MEFPNAVQQQEDDLDVSPDDEEEEEETRVEVEEEEDPYEYDEELPVVPQYGRNDSAEPNSLDDDLILEGKQHRDKDGIILGMEWGCDMTEYKPSDKKNRKDTSMCYGRNKSTEELKHRVCVEHILNLAELLASVVTWPQNGLKGTFEQSLKLGKR
jgi:hypothetical protein